MGYKQRKEEQERDIEYRSLVSESERILNIVASWEVRLTALENDPDSSASDVVDAIDLRRDFRQAMRALVPPVA